MTRTFGKEEVQSMITRFTKTALVLSFAILLNACYETTPATDIRKLADDGYLISWTKQRGEYWDEFSARKGKKSEEILVNRKKVKRANMKAGHGNTVELMDDGTLVVTEVGE